jgi:hypothetical protein
MSGNFKLATKFTLFLSLVFIGAILLPSRYKITYIFPSRSSRLCGSLSPYSLGGKGVISGFALSKALERKVEDEVNYRGQVLMQMVKSVRNYTNTRINPLLAQILETQEEFIPEAITSFSAREVFENFCENKEYKNYFGNR